MEWVSETADPLTQIHHPLHVPSFIAQFNAFWSSDDIQRCSSAADWYALMLIVLCLGAHFGDADQEDLEMELVTVSVHSMALMRRARRHSPRPTR